MTRLISSGVTTRVDALGVDEDLHDAWEVSSISFLRTALPKMAFPLSQCLLVATLLKPSRFRNCRHSVVLYTM